MSEEINGGAALVSFIGAVVATCMSWATNHSILWAIFHFLCGWVYVIYHVIAY